MMAIPSVMKAIEIARPGGPEVLIPVRRAVPEVGPYDLLIHVEAAGVNRPDALQRQGLYPPPPGVTDIPGLEVAGSVVARGPKAVRWRIGDTVTALLSGGGYAEYACADSRHALPIPPGVDALAAAGLPEVFFTLWAHLFLRGGLREGETLLVHGGTSGIGTAAIQLARALGATVIATAGSDDKCAICRKLGAAHAVNHRKEDFVAMVKEVTAGRGADVILDMVGGDYVQKNYEAAAVEGRIVQIGFLRGARVEVDFSRLMLKRLTHTGATLRSRDPAFKAMLAAALEEKVWPLFAKGAIRPVVDRVFPLDKADEAHRRLEGEHVGKIVLETTPTALGPGMPSQAYALDV